MHRLEENIYKSFDLKQPKLIFKIYKEHLQTNIYETNIPITEWGKCLNRLFTKEDTQVANRI